MGNQIFADDELTPRYFDIYRKNKKAVSCHCCGKYCKKGEATKFVPDYGRPRQLKHFVCESCWKSIIR